MFTRIYSNLCLYTLPSPGGSGKTYTIAREAIRLARRGDRVLIAQPTIDLIDKTLEDEIKQAALEIDCVAIHSGCSRNVLIDVKARLQAADDRKGDITLVTHAEFIKLQHLQNRGDLYVFVDEIPAAEKCLTHNLPNTHQMLTDKIYVTAEGPFYDRVAVIDDNDLKEIAKNKKGDDLWMSLFDTAWTLLSDAWDTYVNKEQYRKLLSGKGRQLTFFSVLRPEVFKGYKKVTIASANLEDSILYHLFTQQGVTFKTDNRLVKQLKYCSHTNGHLVTIYYVIAGFWSKNRQNKALNGVTGLNRIISAANQLFEERRFLWMANKSVVNSIFAADQAIRLPNVPHGFNQYSEVDNIVVLSALNPSPSHFSFLKSRGISENEVRVAIHMNNVYQAILRTSIRSDSLTPKTVLVPDYNTASYLASLLPGCRLEQLNGTELSESESKCGRRCKYSTNNEKMRQHRRRIKEKKASMLNEMLCLNAPSLSPNEDVELCNGITNNTFISDLVTQHTVGTLYSGIKSHSPIGYINSNFNENASMMEFLSVQHRRIIQSKDENMLISPAVFNPAKCKGTKRGIDNIEYLQGIWLDFDSGQLKAEEIPELFPDVQMIICNTYSHTSDNPRFRVFIPTIDRLNPGAYTIIWDQIKYKLEESGYAVGKKTKMALLKESGLDASKRSPNSLFYLPSQAKDPKHSFFFQYIDGRSALNVREWIEYGVFDFQPVAEGAFSFSRKNQVLNDALIAAATVEWRAVPKGMGNDAFFTLATSLRKAGMDDFEISATLFEEAGYAHSPVERRRQIPSVMKSLAKKKASIENP